MSIAALLLFVGFAIIVLCCAVVVACDIKGRKKWRIVNMAAAIGGIYLIVGALLI